MDAGGEGVPRHTVSEVALTRTWYISAIDLFQGLRESEIDTWFERCERRAYQPGERVIDASTTRCERVGVVREGVIRLVLERTTGRAETVDLLGRGQLFGVTTAFGGGSMLLHADALTRVVACEANGKAFLVAMASCPAVALNLVRQAGGRVMQFGSEFSRPQPESAEVRLAEVLKRLASTAGEAVNGGMRIPRCVSRGTLAHQVGCTRETVARMLSTLEVAGGVVRHGRELVVDANRLDTIISVRLLARNG